MQVRFYGTGLVWDGENNKLLCEFKNGEYVTKNEREEKILSSLGYECEKKEKPQEEVRIVNIELKKKEIPVITMPIKLIEEKPGKPAKGKKNENS